MGTRSLKRRRRRIRTQCLNGSVASVGKRKGSRCQQDDDGDSQDGKRMRCSIPDLPEVVNTPMLPSRFIYLKHLTIRLISGLAFTPSYDYFSLVSFLDASPSLETLTMDVTAHHMEHESVFGGWPQSRQMPEHHHGCLKSVKITGFHSAKGVVELTCYILKNAVSLECLTLDTIYGSHRCCLKTSAWCDPMSEGILREARRAVVAIRTYVEDSVPSTVKFTVLEPCSRCHVRGF